jgi:hypothetical protein
MPMMLYGQTGVFQEVFDMVFHAYVTSLDGSGHMGKWKEAFALSTYHPTI